MYVELQLYIVFLLFYTCRCTDNKRVSTEDQLLFKRNPAPDGHRCGVCPTYFQKICAHDFDTKSTYIFDNHCIMDLFNCRENTRYEPIAYDKCLYFGNFAYVHGFKYEDMDYEEDHIKIKSSKKHPDFIKY